MSSFDQTDEPYGTDTEGDIRLHGYCGTPIPRLGRWTTYFGVGPSFTFLHQNFERDTEEDRIDFGDFDSDIGLNFLGGLRYRSGMFMELKTSVYARPTPTMRLIVGYNF